MTCKVFASLNITHTFHMFHFISLIMYNNIVQFRMNVKYVVDEKMYIYELHIYELHINITHNRLYIDIYVYNVLQKLFLTVKQEFLLCIRVRT